MKTFFGVASPKKKKVFIWFLQTLGAGFDQIFRDFSRSFKDIAKIFRDFAQVLFCPDFWPLHPHLLHN